MKHLALTCVLALVPLAAVAQDWATPEVCTVEVPQIHPEVFAPAGLEKTEARAAQIPNGTGRLWRIESADGAVSHLWGTMHSADPLILDLPQEVRDAIAAARTVAVEIDYIHKSRASVTDAPFYEKRFKEAGDPFAALPPGDSIAGLPPEVTGWIRDRAIALGWTEDVELILSEAGIAEMLLSDPCEDFAAGVLPLQDDYIQLLGRLAGSEILSLEQPNDFLDTLSRDTMKPTAEAIIAVYASFLKPQTDNKDRATSFALYLQGRIGLGMAWEETYLDEILGDAGFDALSLTDAYLLTTRNDTFLTRAKPALDAGGLVMAVGAAHLPGRAGLIEMLRERGYTVARVPLPGEAQ